MTVRRFLRRAVSLLSVGRGQVDGPAVASGGAGFHCSGGVMLSAGLILLRSPTTQTSAARRFERGMPGLGPDAGVVVTVVVQVAALAWL